MVLYYCFFKPPPISTGPRHKVYYLAICPSLHPFICYQSFWTWFLTTTKPRCIDSSGWKLTISQIHQTQPKLLPKNLMFRPLSEAFIRRSWYSVFPLLDTTGRRRVKKAVVCVDQLVASSHKRINFKIATLAYQALAFGEPTYLSSVLTPHQPQWSLRSVNQNLLSVPRCNSSFGQRNFSYCAPKIWNDIPLSVKQSLSLDSFKCNLKIQ